MNSWQQPVAGEPSVGTLHFIPDSDRYDGFILANGTATSFTDVDFSSYVPAGVKAVFLKYAVTFVGNGAADYNGFDLRKKGSSETSVNRLTNVVMAYTNLGAGITKQNYGQIICECDSSGYIQYRTYNGGTAYGGLYLNIIGYYI